MATFPPPRVHHGVIAWGLAVTPQAEGALAAEEGESFSSGSEKGSRKYFMCLF